jgi:hypothetical protein
MHRPSTDGERNLCTTRHFFSVFERQSCSVDLREQSSSSFRGVEPDAEEGSKSIGN